MKEAKKETRERGRRRRTLGRNLVARDCLKAEKVFRRSVTKGRPFPSEVTGRSFWGMVREEVNRIEQRRRRRE